jgi:two-component system chemotaxis response regulator CheY
MMPELDGINFLKQVRESGPNKDIPFIIITAVSDKDNIIKAKNHKVTGYLLKPVEYAKIKKKMEELFPKMRFPSVAS